MKPTAVKKLIPGSDFDDALGDANLQHLLHSLQSKAVIAFEMSYETALLQAPLLPQVFVQVELFTQLHMLMNPEPSCFCVETQHCTSMYNLALHACW